MLLSGYGIDWMATLRELQSMAQVETCYQE